jgi:hypothetical protein
MIWRTALAASLAALVSFSASANQIETSTIEPEIVVPGARLEEQSLEFTRLLSPTPGGSRQLGRWNRNICPALVGAGVDEPFAQALLDRISMRAHALNLRPGRPGCNPNIVIYMTPDARGLAEDVFREMRSLVRHPPGGVRPSSFTEFEAFRDTDRPVRWFHVNAYFTADGRFCEEGRCPVRGTISSRVRQFARQDIYQVVAIVDGQNASGLDAHALGDYLAMITLARIDPNADFQAAPTILNLFAQTDAAPLHEMTAWDVAYLEGLYAAPRNAHNNRVQERQISRTMARSLTE